MYAFHALGRATRSKFCNGLFLPKWAYIGAFKTFDGQGRIRKYRRSAFCASLQTTISPIARVIESLILEHID